MEPWFFLLCLSSGWMQTAWAASVAPTLSPAPVTPTEDQSTQLLDWLTKYGYLPAPDPSTGQLQAWTSVTSAVKAMQRFAGLKDTGILDEETLVLMKSPRCSLPDQDQASVANPERGNTRRRRGAAAMWTRRNINWRLRSYPSSSRLSREMIRSLVYYALRVWSEPTPLDFHEVASAEAADLQVDFLHGYHGDGYPFDGAGGAVGHAFFPSDLVRAGGVHLDAEEDWAFRQPANEGTDLFTVLLHEFGHSLGLVHSTSRHSVMRPYYQGPAGDPLHYSLGPQDLEHITSIYATGDRQTDRQLQAEDEAEEIVSSEFIGVNVQYVGKRNQLLATHAPQLVPDPQLRHRGHHHRDGASEDRCNTSFDAVARIRGETFFFKGQTMWRVSAAGLVSPRGTSVRRLWRGLPPDLPRIQAVLERESDHAIIFISGSKFWLFRDLSLQEGFPQPLSALRMGINLDWADEDLVQGAAATRWGLIWDPQEGPVWGHVGDLKEEQEEEDTWTQLLGGGVSGITSDRDGSVCLFKGDQYWKFSFPGSVVQDGYPRSSATDFLDCSDIRPDLEELSLSLSPPAGRQDYKDHRSEEKATGDYRGRNHWEDKGPHKERATEDTASNVWTKCSCQNGATHWRTDTLMAVSLFITWTLAFIRLH